MGIYNGIHQVVRFKSGELWHFFSLKKKGIVYRRLDDKGLWEEPVELAVNAQEDFSVKIDEKDHLHLICRIGTGEIIYMFFNGRSWSKQTLSFYEPTRYVIKYPTIVVIKNRIHILLVIGTTFNTGFWSLYHYYWDEQTWRSAEVTKFTAGNRLSPYCLDLSEKSIHVVYRGLSTSRFQIYYCRYSLDHGVWSIPENATHSTTDCNMPSMLIKDDMLHLAWTTLVKNDLMVKYKNRSLQNQSKSNWSSESTLSTQGANGSFPGFIWLEGSLWCIWCHSDFLYGCVTRDLGMTWNKAQKLNIDFKEYFYLIDYSTNHPREKIIFKLSSMLGSVDDSLRLPIVRDYMELPDYGQQSELPEWEPEDVSPLEPAVEPEAMVEPSVDYYSSIIRMLETQAKVNDLLLEKLHTLHEDMEQLRKDIKQIQTKGFFSKLFSKNSNMQG